MNSSAYLIEVIIKWFIKNYIKVTQWLEKFLHWMHSSWNSIQLTSSLCFCWIWKHLSKSNSTFISQWTPSVRQSPTEKLQLTCKIEGCRFPLLRVSATFSSHDLASVSLRSIWSRRSIPIGICEPLLTRVSTSSRWGRWVPFYNHINYFWPHSETDCKYYTSQYI